MIDSPGDADILLRAASLWCMKPAQALNRRHGHKERDSSPSGTYLDATLTSRSRGCNARVQQSRAPVRGPLGSKNGPYCLQRLNEPHSTALRRPQMNIEGKTGSQQLRLNSERGYKLPVRITVCSRSTNCQLPTESPRAGKGRGILSWGSSFRRLSSHNRPCDVKVACSCQ